MQQQPTIQISELDGSITLEDLLESEGVYSISLPPTPFPKGFLFNIEEPGFDHFLGWTGDHLEYRRAGSKCVINFAELYKNDPTIVCLIVKWEHGMISMLGFNDKGDKLSDKQPMRPAVPSAHLIRYARKQSLLETTSFPSVEAFRKRVHECLQTINNKIEQTNAYHSLWNVTRDGKKIVDRKPKLEVELQPLIHSWLFDPMLMSGITIAPEASTGRGLLDFLLVGHVEGLGTCTICIELKCAHSRDLEHGYLEQLPAYMRASGSTYGVYGILNFKGQEFGKPDFEGSDNLQFYLEMLPSKKGIKTIEHDNIRVFEFELGKPKTASKK